MTASQGAAGPLEGHSVAGSEPLQGQLYVLLWVPGAHLSPPINLPLHFFLELSEWVFAP